MEDKTKHVVAIITAAAGFVTAAASCVSQYQAAEESKQELSAKVIYKVLGKEVQALGQDVKRLHDDQVAFRSYFQGYLKAQGIELKPGEVLVSPVAPIGPPATTEEAKASPIRPLVRRIASGSSRGSLGFGSAGSEQEEPPLAVRVLPPPPPPAPAPLERKLPSEAALQAQAF